MAIPFLPSATQRKTAARRAVHSAFGVPAFYYTPPGVPDPADILAPPLTVRWHDKLQAQVGNLEDAGYSTIIEGIDRIVFSADQVAGLDLKQGGIVALPDSNMAFILDTRGPPDGPINVTWNCSRTDYPV